MLALGKQWQQCTARGCVEITVAWREDQVLWHAAVPGNTGRWWPPAQDWARQRYHGFRVCVWDPDIARRGSQWWPLVQCCPSSKSTLPMIMLVTPVNCSGSLSLPPRRQGRAKGAWGQGGIWWMRERGWEVIMNGNFEKTPFHIRMNLAKSKEAK